MHSLIFFPDYRAANPYQTLLYEHVDPVVLIEPGDIGTALRRLRSNGLRSQRILFHLHWEDAILRAVKDTGSASQLAQAFLRDVESFVDEGGLLIWTKHNLGPHDFEHAELSEQLSAAIGQLADVVIAHSPAAAKAVVDLYRIGLERVALQLHGNYQTVYTPTARQVARRALGIDDDRRCVLLFGRITPYKGTSELIDALARLADPRLHLLLAGKQPMTPPEIPDSLSNRITIINRALTDAEVSTVFGACDAVALPYRQILTSGTLLLALGYNRPVIVPRLPTLMEVASDQVAFVYDPADREGLARALTELAAAPAEQLRTMGRHAGQIAAGYDWRLAGRQLGDIIHGLLARRIVADRRHRSAHRDDHVPPAAEPLIRHAAE
jgi:glycosyltransferase involved in cell wall biosynthesis